MPVDISRGFDPGYFLKSVDADGQMAYYTDAAKAGLEPAGRWAGRGLDELGLTSGSVVDPDTLRRLFTERISPAGEKLGRNPHTFKKLDDEVKDLVETLLLDEPKAMRTAARRRELTFMVRVEMGQEHVNFYDVGFSVPKSVSLLQVGWTAAAEEARAAGDPVRAAQCDAKAEEIEQAVMESAKSIVAMVEQHVYLRTGHHSATTGDYKRPAGLAAAIFMHHTSRTAAGCSVPDPQLHAHIAIWAYAQRADQAESMDSIFRCIDARGLYRWKSYFAACAELELEQELQRLGYALVRRPDGDFEVGGLARPKVLKQFSSRTAEILKERGPHVQAFIDRNGQAPSRAMLRVISKNATMKTRQRKDYAADRARQLAEWDRKYRAATLQALHEIPEMVAEYAQGAPRPPLLDAVQRVQCIAVALATLQKQRAKWSAPHLALEIRKTLPVLPESIPREDVQAFVLSMVREALASDDVVLLDPPPAVEMPAGGVAAGDPPPCTKPADFSQYATLEHLLAEGRLLDNAGRPAEPLVNPAKAAKAVGSTVERIQAEQDRQASDDGAGEDSEDLSSAGLSNDQALALFGLLTSRKGVNVLVGAAGTGKSHVVSRLAAIVRAETGARVVGVTASENAARVLAAEGLHDAHNIAHFLGYVEGSDERRGHLPLNAGDWLVVDEAGTVGTAMLLELNEVVTARGAYLLLTGDPQQLASVDAGGGMHLVAEEHGFFEIHEVLRFASSWEGPASLRIRAGDTTAAREYIERGRVIEGSEEHVKTQLVKQYTGSLVAGRNTLLVTDANEGAEELAALVREQLIGLGQVDAEGPAVRLNDGNEASRGDLIRAMKNDKRIRAGERKLTNRDVLEIERVEARHAVARHLVGSGPDGERQYGARFTLPLAYLQDHSALAYGGNVFVGQGRTVDDSYELLSDATTRQSLYVAATRGRERNVVGVITERGTEDPVMGGQAPVRQVTAEALLAKAITRQQDSLTATQYIREQQDVEYSMPALIGRWQYLTRDASFTAYDAVMQETMPAEAYERLAAEPERSALVRHLRAAELAGADGSAVLREAIGQRDFAGASSVAAVLHGRVARLTGPVSGEALTSYSAATPDLADPQAASAARELARLADERTAELGRQAAADRPVWALHALGEVPPDPIAREDWASAAGKVAAWRELSAYADPVQAVGPAPKAGAVELRAAWRAAADAAGLSKDDQGIRETSEMLLLARDREAGRLREWAPADVTEERQLAELARGEAIAEAQMAEAAARNAQLASEAEALRGLAASHKQLADEVNVRAAWLAEQDEHRREWDARNEAKLTGGAQARAELERRQEAGELADEFDVVRAWLGRAGTPEKPVAAAQEPAGEPEARERAVEPEAAAAEPERDAEAPEAAAAAEPEPEPDRRAEPVPAPEPEPEPVAEDAGQVKAEHYKKVAEHRERAVERPGRADLESIRQAQARLDEARAEAKRAEPVPNRNEPERDAEASADFEAGE